MSLNNYRVGAAVAVSDMDRAKEFYEGRLGLTAAAGGDAPTAAGPTNVAS